MAERDRGIGADLQEARQEILKVYGKDRVAASNVMPAEEDERAFIQAGALVPPYDPTQLCMLLEHSNALRQNVDAYVTNIDAFGHRFEPVYDLDDSEIDERIRAVLTYAGDTDVTEDEVKEAVERIRAGMRSEKARLEAFFEFCSTEGSFSTLRRRTRQDIETTGNGYWEVLRDAEGRVAQFAYVPGFTMRLMPLGPELVPVTQMRRVGLQYEPYEAQRRMRRYLQIYETRTMFFKEFGDPRVVSRKTGRVFDSVEALTRTDKADGPATEMIHFKVPSARTPYGVPRWIGALLSVVGSRLAEEVNWSYFENKGVPPLAVLVSGGRISDETGRRLQDFVETEIKGKRNYHKILVLDADLASGGDYMTSGRMKVDFKPLTGAQHNDALFQNYDERNMDKVGMAFRLPRMLRGDIRDFNRACYSEDTETLTERGWKLWHEIAPDERIAAFSPKTGLVEFVVPERLHTYDVQNEEMVHLLNQHTDCLVTPDHKMLVRSAQTRAKDPEWTECKAAEIPFDRFEVRLAADAWAGREPPEMFLLPKSEGCKIERGHDHTRSVAFSDWLEFLGYWISEGGLLQTDHPAASYLVYLDQKKPEIRQRIRDCLDRLGWTYSVQEKPCGTTHFLLSNRCLRDWLATNCGTHSHEKRIPWEYLELDRGSLETLLAALMAGDGSIDTRENRTSRCYYSTSTVLAGQVQRLFVQLGFRASVILGAQCWRVMSCEKRTTRLTVTGQARTPASVTRERYAGIVYCFSVPGYGFFVTRRNGKIAIQGNTADAALTFAEAQVFSPEREEFDFMLNRNILPALGVRFWRYRSNAPSLRDPLGLAPVVQGLVMGNVLTPEEGRQLAEGIFNREFKRIDEEWVRQPVSLTLAGIQTEHLGEWGYAPEEEPATASPGSSDEVAKARIAKLRHLPPAIAGQVRGLLKLRDALRSIDEAEAEAEFAEAKGRERRAARVKP